MALKQEIARFTEEQVEADSHLVGRKSVTFEPGEDGCKLQNFEEVFACLPADCQELVEKFCQDGGLWQYLSLVAFLRQYHKELIGRSGARKALTGVLFERLSYTYLSANQPKHFEVLKPSETHLAFNNLPTEFLPREFSIPDGLIFKRSRTRMTLYGFCEYKCGRILDNSEQFAAHQMTYDLRFKSLVFRKETLEKLWRGIESPNFHRINLAPRQEFKFHYVFPSQVWPPRVIFENPDVAVHFLPLNLANVHSLVDGLFEDLVSDGDRSLVEIKPLVRLPKAKTG